MNACVAIYGRLGILDNYIHCQYLARLFSNFILRPQKKEKMKKSANYIQN